MLKHSSQHSLQNDLTSLQRSRQNEPISCPASKKPCVHPVTHARGQQQQQRAVHLAQLKQHSPQLERHSPKSSQVPGVVLALCIGWLLGATGRFRCLPLLGPSSITIAGVEVAVVDKLFRLQSHRFVEVLKFGISCQESLFGINTVLSESPSLSKTCISISCMSEPGLKVGSEKENENNKVKTNFISIGKKNSTIFFKMEIVSVDL